MRPCSKRRCKISQHSWRQHMLDGKLHSPSSMTICHKPIRPYCKSPLCLVLCTRPPEHVQEGRSRLEQERN